MNYKIEHNKAIEFVGALLKYGFNKQQQANWTGKEFQEGFSKGALDFSPTKDVKDWLSYVDNDISPFLRNDMLLLVANVMGLLDSCFDLVIRKDLKSPQELINSIKTMDSQDFIKSIYYYYNPDLPFESDDNAIKDNLSALYNDERASIFIQIKNHPEEFKKKVIETFEVFYTYYYKPFEEKVYSFMEEKCNNHNELFQKDPIYFLNAVGLGDYTELIAQNSKMRIFVSFYVDLGLFHFNIDDTFIMFYGHSIEEKLNNMLVKEKSKDLFKALSDEKRLEIIRVTSKRPWYNKELADYFNLSTATLSYHINLLLNLGILNFKPSFNNRYYYTTNKEHLKKLFEISLSELIEQDEKLN